MFQLPKLTTEIDCGPIGYPGLLVKCWLNVTYDNWEPPEEPLPWETLYYYGTARIIESLTFPAAMTDTGQAETIELGGPEQVYQLMNTRGFDQSIVSWALSQYSDKRQERMRAEAKN